MKNLRGCFVAPLAAVSLLASALVQAAPGASQEQEIRHLIAFVADSGCAFIRNGEAHAPKAASEHLAMKYGKARSRLATPEQFIDLVASRSSFTGKEYRVQCPGKAEGSTQAWLKAELMHWRAVSPTVAGSTVQR